MRSLLLSVAALSAAQAVHAQDGTTVTMTESEEYGQFLTVDDRPVYVFSADMQVTEDGEAVVACIEECLDAWIPITSQGAPGAGEGVMPDMLGSLEHEGQLVVTYNGWPLYHFARDTEGNPPTGQEIEGFGGEWFLLGPDGEQIEGEGV
jgi:predicted lipoprotein with Yx(FWY)xxD motif